MNRSATRQDPGSAVSQPPGTSWAAHLALAAAVGLAVATIVGHLLNRAVQVEVGWSSQAEYSWLINTTSAVMFGVPGWYLARHRPGVLYGWLALAAAVAHGLGGVGLEWAIAALFRGEGWPGAGVGIWLAAWGPLVEQPVLMAAYALYPEGHLPRGWLRWPAAISVLLPAAGVIDAALDRHPARDAGAGRFADITVRWGLPGANASPDVIALFFAPAAVLAIGVLIVRWRRARDEERRVLLWLLAVGSLVTVLVPVSIATLSPPVAIAIGQGTTLVEIAVIVGATLRHQVYGIELILNRTLVYATLTALVSVVFGLVGIAATALGFRGAGMPSYLSAALCVVTLAPARAQVQRRVDQFLYGSRGDRYRALSEVSTNLESAPTPGALLRSFVDVTREVLRVPYVALEFSSGGGDETDEAVTSGTRASAVSVVPLVHQGHRVGRLVVGRRIGETRIPAHEQELLVDLARQGAVAVSAALLATALQRSREQIVSAREEERRRLRMDLHDGLGPQLTGVALGLDVTAEKLAADQPGTAREIERLRMELEEAIADVRRLVQGLGPPRLDEVGLVGAVREAAGRAGRSGLQVELLAPATTPPLAAAVEVATYRIVAEALTNVVRHASARTCRIELSIGDVVRIRVSDDGVGFSSRDGTGTGTESMRQRAEELGGRWEIKTGPNGGCTVVAEIPAGAR